MPEPKDLEAVIDGQRIAGLLPELKHELGRMRDMALNQAFIDLRQGTMTPEKAIQVLQELRAYSQLESRFDKAVKMAQNAGERAAPDMGIDNG